MDKQELINLIDSSLQEISSMCDIVKPIVGKLKMKDIVKKILTECSKPISKDKVANLVKSYGYGFRGDPEKLSISVYVGGINPLMRENLVKAIGGRDDKRYISVDNPNYKGYVAN